VFLLFDDICGIIDQHFLSFLLIVKGKMTIVVLFTDIQLYILHPTLAVEMVQYG
jgi:hypothetical protein